MIKVHTPHPGRPEKTSCGYVITSGIVVTDTEGGVTCKRCLVNIRHQKRIRGIKA